MEFLPLRKWFYSIESIIFTLLQVQVTNSICSLGICKRKIQIFVRDGLFERPCLTRQVQKGKYIVSFSVGIKNISMHLEYCKYLNT